MSAHRSRRTASPRTPLVGIWVVGALWFFSEGTILGQAPDGPHPANKQTERHLLRPWGEALDGPPFPAHKVAGNVYYVGSRQLASYLIATPEGHFLINSGYEETVPQIRAAIESLGFKLQEVKYLLASHAHSDHVAGHALVKELSGAQVCVMRGDDDVIASGGKGQYLYDNDLWKPCVVDRVLIDGEELKLGGTTLTARRTPGHTRGCTTWTWPVSEQGTSHLVVVIGSPNVNPGYRLAGNRDYPEIADDFTKTFTILKSLPCDLFLGAHGTYYQMESKYARLKAGGENSFVDPTGYKQFVEFKERVFRQTLADQQLVLQTSPQRSFTYIDLQPRGNRKLSENQGTGRPGTDLSALPSGPQTFGDIRFKVDEKLIQLGSTVLQELPEKVEGLSLGLRFDKLHFLHATCFGGSPNEEGKPWFVNDGTLIGEYKVKFDDRSSATIPIVYGEDVRDWFYVKGERAPNCARVAWEGSNKLAEQVEKGVRLYVSTWDNPWPQKWVTSIDYSSQKEQTVAAPFCVAITAEVRRAP